MARLHVTTTTDRAGVTETSADACLDRMQQMRQGRSHIEQKDALLWAEQLTMRVSRVLAAHPNADPDNVRHTLILLEKPPFERLQRSLIRGRATAIRRK